MSWILGNHAKIFIVLDNIEERQKKTMDDGAYTVYSDNEDIRGKVRILTSRGREVEHNGIMIQLIGKVECYTDSSISKVFIENVKSLAPPGKLLTNMTFGFEFSGISKKLESYNGINIRVIYYLKAVIVRRISDISRKEKLWIIKYAEEEDTELLKEVPIHMEAGIENCLLVDFKFRKKNYFLDDVIIGKVKFKMIRLMVKKMMIIIQMCETCGTHSSKSTETRQIRKFEIMMGNPFKGDMIPIRFFLSSLQNLTPTYDTEADNFSVKYTINLVLIDEQKRRYYKMSEIQLFRRNPSSSTILDSDSYFNITKYLKISAPKKDQEEIKKLDYNHSNE